ncbi:MAG: DUF5320 domain-containing protein [Anaerolineae bacterium]|nr:DUF5320 domain-containing protein [Anaerolineae bacterium]
MPRGDRTGPAGMGPMTGRAAGYCAGYDVPGFQNPVGGRMGMGMRWGGGWRGGGRGGWRFWRQPFGPAYVPPAYAPPVTPEQEAGALRTQAEWLGQQLETIRQRLSELEK